MPSPQKKKKVCRTTSRTDLSLKPKATAKKKAASSRKPKIPKAGVHRGVAYDSYNEYYTIDWLEELKRAGYILSYRRADSYVLTEAVKHQWTNEKGKTKTQHIMHGSVYTPEFEVIWQEDRYADFCWLMGDNSKYMKPLIAHRNGLGQVYTILECKSDFDRTGSIRLWGNNMKVLFARYGIYVNLVQPNDFFAKTFCPVSYLKTPANMDRRLKFEPTMLQDYLRAIKPEQDLNEE